MGKKKIGEADLTEYPQTVTPKRNHRALKVILGAFVAAVVITGSITGGVTWANGITAQRTHIEAVADAHQITEALPHLQAQTVTDSAESDTTTADEAIGAEQVREAEAAAAQAAAAAAQAAADAAAKAPHALISSGSGAPSGALVPFIPSSDPNNANGGDYEDPGIFCASHSASGNPPVCD